MKFILENLCTINELAKILNINKHTILYYEKEGIFSPFFRGENGYRYYSGEQLAHFRKILYLRELGFSIALIKTYLKENNYSFALESMEKQIENNKIEIENLNKKNNELLKGIQFFKNLQNIEKNINKPFVQYFKETRGSIISQKNLDLYETIINMKKIDELYNNLTWSEKFSFGFIIKENNINKLPLKLSYFFVEKENIPNFTNYNFPEGEYLVLYSDKKNLDECIHLFLNWSKENNFKIIGDLYIEDTTTFNISNKYNNFTKLLKALIKKVDL